MKTINRFACLLSLPEIMFGCWLCSAVSLLATPGLVDHFEWSAISSPQRSGTPFPVTITARDATNNVVADFTNTVALQVVTMPGGEVTIGTNTQDAPFPMDASSYTPQRSQVIYLADEIGGPRRISALALNVKSFTNSFGWPETLYSWTIRIKHTPLSSYSSYLWEGSNWTTVYQTNLTITTTGWMSFTFAAPFDYNGVDNLMVDFSYSHAEDGLGSSIECATTIIRDVNRMLWGFGEPDPLSWNGEDPNPWQQEWIPDIRLTCLPAGPTNVVLSPTNTTSFTNGVWSGALTLTGAAPNVVLRAVDASNHVGLASSVTVLDTNDLALFVSATPNPATVFSNVSYTLAVMNAGPADATAVRVTNNLPAGVSLVSAVSGQGSCSTNGQLVVWDVGTVTNWMTATATIVATPTIANLRLTNVAMAVRGEAGDQPANNVATNIVVVSPPLLMVGNSAVFEGNTGTTNAVFGLSLSAPSALTVSVNCWTSDGTAYSSSDYVHTNGWVTFAPGVINQTFAVQVRGDIAVEPNEVFYLNLTAANAVLATNRATGLILNDEVPGQVHHFAWAPISSPQHSGLPFAANISALDISNNPAASFSGTVDLGLSTAGATNLTVSPASTPNFSGGTWSGNVTLTGNATNVVLTATDAAGHSGTANSITVWAVNDLVLSASAAPNPVAWSSNLTYSLQVLNTGPAAATGVLLTNVLPPGVDIVSTAASQGSTSTNGNLVVCDFGALTGGAAAAATIVVMPTVPSTVLTNVASVGRNEADANLTNNSVTTTVSVGARPPVFWTNTAGGDWSVAANWKPQRVPQAADYVIITNNGNYAVNLDTNVTIANLIFGANSSNQMLNLAGYQFTVAEGGTNRMGSTFLGPGTLAIEKTLVWQGVSNCNVTITVAPDAVLTLDTSGTKYLTASTLHNGGTVNWLGGDLLAVFPTNNSIVMITNLPGAAFNFQGFGWLNYTTGGFTNTQFLFDNAGAINKTNPATTTFNAYLRNSGTVAVRQGALQFGTGFTSSGIWDLAVSNAVSLYGGAFSFDPSCQFLNTGNFLFDHQSYSITVNGTIPRLTWGDGSFRNSTLTIPTNGTLLLDSKSYKYLINSTLINAGTVICQGGYLVALFTANNQTNCITNLAGALFDIQSAPDFRFDTNGYSNLAYIFHNAGTLRKRISTGTALFELAFSNPGTVEVQAGALQFKKGFTSSGTWDLAVTNAVQFYAGTFNFEPSSQFPNTGNFLWHRQGYIIAINGTVRNLTWGNGYIVDSMLSIPTNGVLNMTSDAFKYLVRATLVNAGTVNCLVGCCLQLNAGNNQSILITNLPGALFDIQADSNISSNTATSGTNCSLLFYNAGTLRKRTSTGTAILDLPFVNTGTVQVQAGALQFNKGFTSSGIWDLAVSNAVYLTGAYPTYTFEPASQFPDTGNFIFNQSTTGITLNGTLRKLAWRNGTLVSSTLTIATNGVLTLDNASGTMSLVASTLANAGTVNWSAGIVRGDFWGNNQTDVITNLPGAIFNIQGSGALDFNPTTRTNVLFHFGNAGTIVKTGTAAPGFEARLHNSGTIELRQGTLNVTSNTFLQTAGLTLLNGGSLQASKPIQILGGMLAGTNTITGSVTNGGTVCPGNPIGTLTITGAYVQTPPGALNVDIAGTNAGTTFDRLAVSGAATLAGTLNGRLTNGFTPAVSNQFQILNAASLTGTCSSMNAPGFGVSYTNTPAGVKLTYLGTPLPPPWTCGWCAPVCVGGQISLSLTSTVPGYNYVILGSSNLLNWTPLQTNVTPFTLVVTNHRPVQFYRAIYQP